MMLYIASDRPVPLVAWNDGAPSFNVSKLNENSKAVRQRFSKPHIYYLGSHQGCSCGFSYGRDTYDEEEESAARESVRRLSAYLAQAIEIAGPLELYSCWDGDQEDEPQFRDSITPNEIGGDAFWFRERQFITLTR